jgi:hypothetical protein
MLKTLTPVLVVSLLAALPVNAQPRRLVQLCKPHMDRAEGFGGSRSQGLNQARANWGRQVLWHDGPRWSSYRRSCNKNESCSPRFGVFRCFVSARPGPR